MLLGASLAATMAAPDHTAAAAATVITRKPRRESRNIGTAKREVEEVEVGSRYLK
jgi:hypothetical protein